MGRSAWYDVANAPSPTAPASRVRPPSSTGSAPARPAPAPPPPARLRGQAAEQHGERAGPVHEEPRGGLADRRGGVEEGDQEPERDVRNAELLAEDGKERRQREAEEVAPPVGDAHEPDHAGVPAEGLHVNGHAEYRTLQHRAGNALRSHRDRR